MRRCRSNSACGSLGLGLVLDTLSGPVTTAGFEWGQYHQLRVSTLSGLAGFQCCRLVSIYLARYRLVGILWPRRRHRYASIDNCGRERTIQRYVNHELTLDGSTHNAGVGGSSPPVATILLLNIRYYRSLWNIDVTFWRR